MSARSTGSSSTTPAAVADAVLDALRAGADEEQIGRALAYAAALRILRFHTQNDYGDWDSVHHTFTAATRSTRRSGAPTIELLRGAVHAALRIYLDRFLNVPPPGPARDDRHPRRARALLRRPGRGRRSRQRGLRVPGGGGSRPSSSRARPCLLAEDAGFHCYQPSRPGSARRAWPEGSEEAALILSSVARFLSAHAPTRRELPTVVASPHACAAVRRSTKKRSTHSARRSR